MKFFVFIFLLSSVFTLQSQRINYAILTIRDTVIDIRVRGERPPINLTRIEYSFLKDSTNTLDVNMYFQGCQFAAIALPFDTTFSVPNNLPFDLLIKTIRDTMIGCPSPLNPILTFTYFKNYAEIVNISEANVSNYIQIYPNPAKDNLLLDIGSIEGEKSIQLLDIQGRKVNEEIKVLGTKIQIDVSAFQKGMYILEVKSSKGVVRRRFDVMD